MSELGSSSGTRLRPTGLRLASQALTYLGRSLSGVAERSESEDGRTMHHVYILRSITFPEQTYIGATEDIEARLKDHNSGRSPHTSKFRPWSVICSLAFVDKTAAYEFERYLKSHSGRAFAKKRLMPKSQ